MGDPTVELNWQAIARAGVHPLRVEILELVAQPPPARDPGWSAKTIATRLGATLGDASYHVRALRDQGLLVDVDRRQVRGAIQTFYCLAAAAIDTP